MLVYKTIINHKHDVGKVQPYFKTDSDFLKWNVNIGVEDRVLRVEAHSDISD